MLLLKFYVVGPNVILDLWGISFHPVVVVGLGNNLLFDSSVGHSDMLFLVKPLQTCTVLELFSSLEHQNCGYANLEVLYDVKPSFMSVGDSFPANDLMLNSIPYKSFPS